MVLAAFLLLFSFGVTSWLLRYNSLPGGALPVTVQFPSLNYYSLTLDSSDYTWLIYPYSATCFFLSALEPPGFDLFDCLTHGSFLLAPSILNSLLRIWFFFVPTTQLPSVPDPNSDPFYPEALIPLHFWGDSFPPTTSSYIPMSKSQTDNNVR